MVFLATHHNDNYHYHQDHQDHTHSLIPLDSSSEGNDVHYLGRVAATSTPPLFCPALQKSIPATYGGTCITEPVKNTTAHGYLLHCCRVLPVNNSVLYQHPDWELTVEDHTVQEVPPHKHVFIRFVYAVTHIHNEVARISAPTHIAQAITSLVDRQTVVFAVDDISSHVWYT